MTEIAKPEATPTAEKVKKPAAKKAAAPAAAPTAEKVKKPAAKKAAAPAAAPTVDYQSLILDAITARIESTDVPNQKKILRAEHGFFDDANGKIILEKASEWIDIPKLAAQIARPKTSSKDVNFVAVYALQKIRKMMYALANNTKGFIDPYTSPILLNLAKLQTMTAKSRLVALSKAIEYTELDKVQAIKRMISVAINTADTQASSSKQLFLLLNLTTGTKGRKDDDIEYKDTPIANRVRSWYVDAQ
jgi:hypothetical protein